MRSSPQAGQRGWFSKQALSIGGVIATICLLLGLRASPVRSEDTAPAAASGSVVRFYTASMAGMQVAGVRLELVHDDGMCKLDSVTLKRMIRDSAGRTDVFESKQTVSETFDGDYRLMRGSSIEQEGGQTTTIAYDIGEKSISYSFTGPGTSEQRNIPLPKDWDCDMRVFHSLRAQYKRESLSRTYSEFDPNDATFRSTTLSIDGKENVLRNGSQIQAFKVTRKQENGSHADFLVDSDYLPISGSLDGGVLLSWVDGDPFDFAPRCQGISISKPVDLAIAEWRNLERLTLSVSAGGDRSSPLFETNAYHSVERDTNGVYTLELRSNRATDGFKPDAFPIQTDDAEIARYLKATPHCQSDHERIVATAKSIAGDAADSLDAARRIVDWTGAHFTGKTGSRGSATALEALDSGEGDCTEHAALVVALCRALGIPARNVSGMEYIVHNGEAILGFHAWAEAWVGQWIALDATVGETGTTARYVHFGYDEPGEAGGGPKLLRCVGGFEAHVLGYKCFGKDAIAIARQTTRDAEPFPNRQE